MRLRHKISRPASSDSIPLGMLYLLWSHNQKPLDHQVRIKCSNIGVYRGYFTFKWEGVGASEKGVYYITERDVCAMVLAE